MKAFAVLLALLPVHQGLHFTSIQPPINEGRIRIPANRSLSIRWNDLHDGSHLAVQLVLDQWEHLGAIQQTLVLNSSVTHGFTEIVLAEDSPCAIRECYFSMLETRQNGARVREMGISSPVFRLVDVEELRPQERGTMHRTDAMTNVTVVGVPTPIIKPIDVWFIPRSLTEVLEDQVLRLRWDRDYLTRATHVTPKLYNNKGKLVHSFMGGKFHQGGLDLRMVSICTGGCYVELELDNQDHRTWGKSSPMAVRERPSVSEFAQVVGWASSGLLMVLLVLT
eukprot:TRINITY_DN41546_c0_g1_i1.p1 TRINITY_DN41546_c0_g1~~TRINITY_DN41546_c0_g1_i1.p1  ORF type:complete len:280 (-),score=-14.42 TRINITY_DN41546_c0_g1_i1:16-855(-)